MKILKWIAILVSGALVIIQFIRPERNVADGNSTNDISATFDVPQDVQQILRTSCFDCHSNATMYPWYAEVQPIGWWLNSHIQEARRELNFSEFAGYRPRRQFIKLQQIAEQVSEDEMPLPSYLIIHTNAKLSTQQRERLVAWTTVLRDSMKAAYPADSLTRRK